MTTTVQYLTYTIQPVDSSNAKVTVKEKSDRSPFTTTSETIFKSELRPDSYIRSIVDCLEPHGTVCWVCDQRSKTWEVTLYGEVSERLHPYIFQNAFFLFEDACPTVHLPDCSSIATRVSMFRRNHKTLVMSVARPNAPKGSQINYGSTSFNASYFVDGKFVSAIIEMEQEIVKFLRSIGSVTSRHTATMHSYTVEPTKDEYTPIQKEVITACLKVEDIKRLFHPTIP